MLAIKGVGADYMSCDFVQVTLGINGPPLDPSVALDYHVDNVVSADDPGIYCYASYAGNPWPLDIWPARIGPVIIENRRNVELSFDLSDVLSVRRSVAYVEVRVSTATVTRELGGGLNPGGEAWKDQDFSLYEVI